MAGNDADTKTLHEALVHLAQGQKTLHEALAHLAKVQKPQTQHPQPRVQLRVRPKPSVTFRKASDRPYGPTHAEVHLWKEAETRRRKQMSQEPSEQEINAWIKQEQQRRLRSKLNEFSSSTSSLGAGSARQIRDSVQKACEELADWLSDVTALAASILRAPGRFGKQRLSPHDE